MRHPLALRSLLACVALSAACKVSPDDLGQDDTTTGAGIGGAGGGEGGAGAGGGAGGAPVVVEPDGPTVLTIVGAVADRDRTALCFLESPRRDDDPALPYPTGGLPFAEARVLPTEGSPVPSTDVELVVLAGALDGLDGVGCRAIADDPLLYPGVDVVPLGLVPGAALAAKRSLLVAVTGCLGGEGHDGPDALAVCGPGYAPDRPTPGVVFAPLSRIVDPEAVGLQVVNATTAGVTFDVAVRPSFDGGFPEGIAQAVVPGAAQPFPPATNFGAAELGAASAATLVTLLPPAVDPVAETPFGEAFEHGGLSSADAANGNNLVFVAVGPSPGQAAGTWWNAFTYVALRASP